MKLRSFTWCENLNKWLEKKKKRLEEEMTHLPEDDLIGNQLLRVHRKGMQESLQVMKTNERDRSMDSLLETWLIAEEGCPVDTWIGHER